MDLNVIADTYGAQYRALQCEFNGDYFGIMAHGSKLWRNGN